MNKPSIINSPKFWIIVAIIFAVGVIRIFLSEIPNIAPIAAMALFGGAYIANKKLSLLVPMLVMMFSDLVLEFAHIAGIRAFGGIHAMMPYVYLSFILVVLLGSNLKNGIKPVRLLGVGIISSVLFFVITNFGVWMSGGLYPATFSGLLQCYVAAIPFFHYTLLGDLFFIGLMFGSFELLKTRYPSLVLAPQ